MKKVDGVIVSILIYGNSREFNREFEVSSETRKRYGVDATSITLKDDDNNIKIEMDTADLIEALIDGGITADDLRLYADIKDGDVLIDGSYVPGSPKGGDPRSSAPYVPGAITNEWK